ncbi:hypothetical protein K438DRAFT_1755196 [Mycena galopus ATCC 62051]|nr:hypothetical protein K438DRAFT_1755196 [Mycena galopus ATCC 62051]
MLLHKAGYNINSFELVAVGDGLQEGDKQSFSGGFTGKRHEHDLREELVVKSLRSGEFAILHLDKGKDANFDIVGGESGGRVLVFLLQRIPDCLGRSLALNVLELILCDNGADGADGLVAATKGFIVSTDILLVLALSCRSRSWGCIGGNDWWSRLGKLDLFSCAEPVDSNAHELRDGLWLPLSIGTGGERRDMASLLPTRTLRGWGRLSSGLGCYPAVIKSNLGIFKAGLPQPRNVRRQFEVVESEAIGDSMDVMEVNGTENEHSRASSGGAQLEGKLPDDVAIEIE